MGSRSKKHEEEETKTKNSQRHTNRTVRTTPPPKKKATALAAHKGNKGQGGRKRNKGATIVGHHAVGRAETAVIWATTADNSTRHKRESTRGNKGGSVTSAHCPHTDKHQTGVMYLGPLCIRNIRELGQALLPLELAPVLTRGPRGVRELEQQRLLCHG